MPERKDGTSKYTSKQERKAEHIEEGYKKKGVSAKEAESRAWATVNKQDGGGKNPGGSGRKSSKKKSAGSVDSDDWCEGRQVKPSRPFIFKR